MLQQSEKSGETKASQVSAQIRTRIAQGHFASTGMLPTVRRLAFDHTTSQVTVIAALRLLCGAGLISSYPGMKGYFLAGTPVPDRAGLAQSKRMRAVEIADDLRQRVLEGEFRQDDVIPSAKSLGSHYRCSSKTIARAFDILAKRAIISRFGKTCRITIGSSASRHLSAVHLANEPQIVLQENLHVDRFLGAIEDGIAARGWTPLRYLLLDEKGADRYTFGELPHFSDIAGFIHFSIRKSAGWWKFFMEHPDKSVSVFMPDEPDVIAPQLIEHPKASFFMPDNFAAGATIGAHLAGLGHRSVAFFSNHGATIPWVSKRIAGLRDSLGTSVNDTAVLRIFAPAESDTTTGLKGGYRLLAPDSNAAPGLEIRRVQSKIAGLNGFAARSNLMKASFEEALAQNFTAWVCANDDLAATAKEFLDKKGIRIPDRISLCGFDNNLLSYILRITSFDFRYDRLGSIALQWLAEPDTLALSPDRVLKIPGTLRPRFSTIG